MSYQYEIRKNYMTVDITSMGNNKSTTPIFLGVPFLLFFVAVLPGASISADEAAGKKEAKEQKNPSANTE